MAQMFTERWKCYVIRGRETLVGAGPDVRPYVNAGVGGQVFMTESAVEGTDTHVALASSTNQSDGAIDEFNIWQVRENLDAHSASSGRRRL